MNTAALSPKDRLVVYAQKLGFDSCRVASAGMPRHAAEFRAWLDDGAAGEMEWMERGAEKRCDPDRILRGARSIIVVSLNYWQGGETAIKERRFTNHRTNDGGLGGSATLAARKSREPRYALGARYPQLMLGKSAKLRTLFARPG